MRRSERDGGPLLAPWGRAEPDDARRWLELGGLLALQRAQSLTRPAAIRLLRGVAPALEPGAPVAVHPRPGTAPDVERMLIEEMPLWVAGGALLAAIALGQRTAVIVADDLDRGSLRLVETVIGRLAACGFGASGGLSGASLLRLGQAPTSGALSGLEALRLVECLRRLELPSTTLVAVTGRTRHPGVIEVPAGSTAEEILSLAASGGEGPSPRLYSGVPSRLLLPADRVPGGARLVVGEE